MARARAERMLAVARKAAGEVHAARALAEAERSEKADFRAAKERVRVLEEEDAPCQFPHIARPTRPTRRTPLSAGRTTECNQSYSRLHAMCALAEAERSEKAEFCAAKERVRARVPTGRRQRPMPVFAYHSPPSVATRPCTLFVLDTQPLAIAAFQGCPKQGEVYLGSRRRRGRWQAERRG